HDLPRGSDERRRRGRPGRREAAVGHPRAGPARIDRTDHPHRRPGRRPAGAAHRLGRRAGAAGRGPPGTGRLAGTAHRLAERGRARAPAGGARRAAAAGGTMTARAEPGSDAGRGAETGADPGDDGPDEYLDRELELTTAPAAAAATASAAAVLTARAESEAVRHEAKVQDEVARTGQFPVVTPEAGGVFRSLKVRNYRLYFTGN